MSFQLARRLVPNAPEWEKHGVHHTTGLGKIEAETGTPGRPIRALTTAPIGLSTCQIRVSGWGTRVWKVKKESTAKISGLLVFHANSGCERSWFVDVKWAKRLATPCTPLLSPYFCKSESCGTVKRYQILVYLGTGCPV
jgi:hypothetical protein